MPQIPLEVLHDVIVRSFQLNDFRQLLKYKLGIDLDAVVGNVGFSEAVEQALDHIEDRGLLPALVAAIAKERPLREDVQNICRQYAVGLVSELDRQQVSDAVADAYRIRNSRSDDARAALVGRCL